MAGTRAIDEKYLRKRREQLQIQLVDAQRTYQASADLINAVSGAIQQVDVMLADISAENFPGVTSPAEIEHATAETPSTGEGEGA